MAEETNPVVSSSIPPTMRAWVRPRRGSPQTSLQLVTGLPVPTAPTGSSSDVLIRVSHVALQASSELVMRVIPSLPFNGPWIPELELSGEVVAAGDGAPVELRIPGTHVVAYANVFVATALGRGVLTEYVRLPGSNIVRISDAVDMASAAGISSAATTSFRMVRSVGVREGHTVLVNGASGSIGSTLVQVCKVRGARVVGVASGGNEAMVRGLGADEVKLSVLLCELPAVRPRPSLTP